MSFVWVEFFLQAQIIDSELFPDYSKQVRTGFNLHYDNSALTKAKPEPNMAQEKPVA